MFTKRRARKQAELHEELGAALRAPDAEVRRKAAIAAAGAGELQWALRELTRAVEREPWTEDFDETVVVGFVTVLRRDQGVRERTQRIFATHLDDPEGFVRAWTELTEDLGGGPAVREVEGELRDDMRARLTYLRDEGHAAEVLSGIGQPLTFARELAFDITALLASLVMRRNTPVPEAEANQVRAEMRAALKKALPHAPGSDERAAVLAPLTRTPAVRSWTDRARAGLYADEALALCAGGERDLVALGTEALAKLSFREVVRRDQVRETLDRLVAQAGRAAGQAGQAAGQSAGQAAGQEPRGAQQDQDAQDALDPFLLSQILACYSHLHVPLPLDDPPFDLFLDGLRHPDPAVRASAADGLDPIATGSPVEGRAVEGLVGLLEHDPEVDVRRHAATALRWLKYGDEQHSGIAADALARQADSPDPEIRAHSVADALQRGAPDAYERLLTGLESPDAHWQLLSGLMNMPGGSGFALPSRSVRKALIERLEALRATGWAERDAAAVLPDADDRAELLTDLLETLNDL
ncbi:HEAT repeat domain-containing protein [Streptomyces sp. NPDC056486]|uniref:HEAT repeat domain-containing protein n=1 Tax=Streptomyces sp. NPDC056486 TaxID=3345835 RepID=UPI0036A4FC0B